ncbi:hypothetical protein BIZ83_gp038 [Erwinia phage vB_EamM_ChrisDB]|uniref:hypothetical protein n=1 Tax=Erwinia phage vB_EamM_ChrisDB TaxID=1883371 RepID=UPI00081CD4C7|nr:hypothetical protein BIZ83_gp038 [Erwinia phage vB_EamM_ChrisDB]ANZ48815.1 hypothetical protein CHRISDB_253 [Erwinia phage vB_EamM_ChrisDB]
MGDVLKFQPKKLEDAAIWIPDPQGGEPKVFTVPPTDMYWWALILDRISSVSRTFEGCVYFFSDPYGFMNACYAGRTRLLEIEVTRANLEGILKAVPYTHVGSLSGILNDDDYHLVHDNALMYIGDDLDLVYEMGLFITPTDKSGIFKITYVET